MDKLVEVLEAAYEYARTESTKEECFFDYVAKYLRNDERVRLLPITPYDRVWTTNKKQKWSVVEVSITSEETTFVAIQQGQNGEIRRKVFNVADIDKSVFAERLCGN